MTTRGRCKKLPGHNSNPHSSNIEWIFCSLFNIGSCCRGADSHWAKYMMCENPTTVQGLLIQIIQEICLASAKCSMAEPPIYLLTFVFSGPQGITLAVPNSQKAGTHSMKRTYEQSQNNVAETIDNLKKAKYLNDTN